MCCNGLQPFCDMTCYKEPQSGVEVCIRQCKCRKTTRQYLCVSTKWLKERGLQDKSIYTSVEKTRVLCIRNAEQLPCATPGHLLRSCDVEGNCILKTYQEICTSNPLGCVEDMQHVSRLSHNYHWGTYKHQHYHLTSLSVEATDGYYSLSYRIAQITDKLVCAGYGNICDTVQKTTLAIKSASYRAISTRRSE